MSTLKPSPFIITTYLLTPLLCMKVLDRKGAIHWASMYDSYSFSVHVWKLWWSMDGEIVKIVSQPLPHVSIMFVMFSLVVIDRWNEQTLSRSLHVWGCQNTKYMSDEKIFNKETKIFDFRGYFIHFLITHPSYLMLIDFTTYTQ